MDIREYLKDNILLFDGGMGTYFCAKHQAKPSECELANIDHPEWIYDIHREYLEAGCKAIKTNTFAVNRQNAQGNTELAETLIQSAWNIANRAAGDSAFVFADIGTIHTSDNAFFEYKFVIDCFLRLGAKYFLFETNASTDGLCLAAEYIKTAVPNAYIIVSFAVQPDGFSREGIFAGNLLREMRDCPAVDIVGLNCVCGARHMLELVRSLRMDIPLSLMPNAGYPTVINNRSFYDGDPVYFAAQLAKMAQEGAAILGGCCGTTPAHIAQTRKALAGYVHSEHISAQTTEHMSDEEAQSPFWDKLCRGEKVIAVELDPPTDVNPEKFMRGAAKLQQAGVDIITLADCPVARVRMDSSLMACKLRRELRMEALPHMTCRDRNINATKALLMGLHMEGIRNVLLVTGDPVPTAERDEIKTVYQFNSRKLANYVSTLNQTFFPSPFHLFGALNVNAVNFTSQLELAKEKLEKGMVGFLTQPILTPQAFENLRRARQELGKCYILGGIIPVVSARNARFMDSEISGISVDPKIIELYEGKESAECEQLAVSISTEIAKRIAPYIDGYYFMTPFMRVSLICKILSEIR